MDVVVACDAKGGIAYQGKLPWHLPEDLKFFRDITQDKVVIMGRKTYDAMPKSLCHERTSIVFSRRGIDDPQVHVVKNLDECLEVLEGYPEKPVCVIGGQDIFELFFEAGLIKRVYLTKVKGEYPADRFFPLQWIENWSFEVLIDQDSFQVCLYTNA